MTADIKPFVSPVRQTYVTGNSLYKQNFYSTSQKPPISSKPPSIEAVGVNARIKSALITDHDLQHYATSKDQGSTQVSYTKFRPVTSHPTTSLLTSLYKQQSFAECRNSQAASKLPNILQSRSSSQSYKRQRELKSFANPSYSATVPASSQSASRSIFRSNQNYPTKSSVKKSNESSLDPSATWTAVHDSILANGHSLLPETHTNNQLYSNVKSQVGDNSRQSTVRSTINYVPFYEIRGRGDGASVVDIPSIDVEGKRIEKTGDKKRSDERLSETTISKVDRVHTNPNSKQSNDEGNNSYKRSDEQLSIKKPESLDDAPSSLISSFLRRSQKIEVGDNQAPTKVEKKVRFSGTVTTNRITEEPSYTVALIESLHNVFKQKNYLRTTHRKLLPNYSPAETNESDVKVTPVNESVDASSKATGEDEDPSFVTPIMKVVVTKREAPTGAETLGSSLSSPRELSSLGTPQQRVASMASRIINNQPNFPDSNIQSRPRPSTVDAIRKGTQATKRASTAGYSRNTEAIARVVKLVPKRQTVVMPNFTKQPAWPSRNFPHHAKSGKISSMTTNNANFSAAVQGNSFSQNSNKVKFKKFSSSGSENLRSRLTNTGGDTSDFKSDGNQQKSNERRKVEGEVPAATPLVATPTAENLSNAINEANITPRGFYTDFQPIPSMPDHINFCDPRKTELILHWLEDVNKKRNIESRLRRVASSKMRA